MSIAIASLRQSLSRSLGAHPFCSSKSFGSIAPGHVLSSVLFAGSGISTIKNVLSFSEIDSFVDGIKRFSLAAGSFVLGLVAFGLTKSGVSENNVCENNLATNKKANEAISYREITKILLDKVKNNPLSNKLLFFNPSVAIEAIEIEDEELKELGLKRVFDLVNNKKIIYQSIMNGDNALVLKQNIDNKEVSFGLNIQYEFSDGNTVLMDSFRATLFSQENTDNKKTQKAQFLLGEFAGYDHFDNEMPRLLDEEDLDKIREENERQIAAREAKKAEEEEPPILSFRAMTSID